MNLDQIITCPICRKTLRKPILVCTRGHGHCSVCVEGLPKKVCCQCPMPIITDQSSVHLEQLIETCQISVKVPCVYATKGCKYCFSLKDDQKDAHELECRFRTYYCEGKRFANWSCNWSGSFEELEKHFKTCHPDNATMNFMSKVSVMDISFKSDSFDLQLIPFFNGAQYFYYKHKVDVAKQKVYWTFQIVSSRKIAAGYYYEFEVFDEKVKEFRKFKVNEFCTSNVVDVEKIFEEERCVVMSFNSIKNYLNRDGKLTFSHRIMAAKKTPK